MKTNKNNFFELYKFISILTLFCLFGIGIQVFGQKTDRKKQPTSKPQTVEIQTANKQSVNYWSETRKKDEPRKLALLVGISDYDLGCDKNKNPIESKKCWDYIPAQPDVDALGKVLQEYGFEVVNLSNSQATKNGIKQAFEKMVSLTNEGDIAYFHFSGHGTQIPDQPQPDGDEDDKIDEALVPFDYGYVDNKDKLIIDDEINKWLDELKNKKPLSVTVTFNSCFSGTATRGGLTRGEPSTPPIANKKNFGIERSPSGLIEGDKKTPPRFVFISAARSDEYAYPTSDIPPMGFFTSALVQSLNQAKSKSDVTYEEIFENIKAIVSKNPVAKQIQNPQIEGDVDNYLFGNKAKVGEKYFTLETEGADYVIQAGRLNGLSVGSKFAIYETGTKKIGEAGKRKLADAEIVKTFLSKSVLKLDKPILSNSLSKARAFETHRNFGIERLQIAVKNLPEIENSIKNYEYVQFSKQVDDKSRNFDLLFRKINPKIDTDLSLSGGDIVMERNNGSAKAFSTTSKNLQSEIGDALEREFHWKGIKQLENPNSDLQVEMRIVPVNVELNSNGGLIFESNPDGSPIVEKFGTPKDNPVFGTSGLELNLGEYYRLEVKNSSDAPVSITILSLTDGKISADFPKSDEDKRNKKNRIVNNGKWIPILAYRVNIPKSRNRVIPFEMDAFKLIATRESSDLSNEVTPSESKREIKDLTEEEQKAKQIPIGQFLGSLFGNTRDIGSIPPFESESWTTTTISYLITCPKIGGKEMCCVDKSRSVWKPIECENKK